MYIIKTKGTARIPDYVQFRDNNFTLVRHVRLDRLEQAINDFVEFSDKELLISKIRNVNYGILFNINGS